MALLAFRRDRLDQVVSGKFAPQPSATVVVLRAGAQANGGQTGTSILVHRGHQFERSGVRKLVVMRRTGGTWSLVASTKRTLSSVDDTHVNLTASLTVLDGDYLVNIGNDQGGPGTANFQASPVKIYSNQGGAGSPISQATVSPNAQGEFLYYTSETLIWEVVLTGGVPTELFTTPTFRRGGGRTYYGVSAADYGVVADGVTDDSDALQRAIDALPLQAGWTGGTVWLPAGIIAVGKTINLREGVYLRGEGAYASIIFWLFGGVGTDVLRWKKSSGTVYGATGIGGTHFGVDCNSQDVTGIHVLKGYDDVTFDTVHVEGVGAAGNGFRFEPDPDEANPVSQTICLVNTYVIHKLSGPCTGANYYFDTCQEMTLVNSKALNWSQNAPTANCFEFVDCRGVNASGISMGGTQGIGIKITSSAVGYSAGLYFYGTTIEAAATPVYIEGTTVGHYVQDVAFYGVRKQEGAVTPPITCGAFVVKNLSRGTFDIPAWAIGIDAACSDTRIHVQDGKDATDAGSTRPHIDADLDSVAGHFNRTLYESLALLSVAAGGPEVKFGSKGRLDYWRLVWAANTTPADFGMQLRYYDAAGVSHNVWIIDPAGATQHWYVSDVERATLSATGLTVVGALSGTSIAGTGTIRSSGGGVGYATGAGGTVTQLTNKSTTVVLDKLTGQITMNNANLVAGAVVSFTLTNSFIAATDLLVLNHVSGGANAGQYVLNAQCGTGSAVINVKSNKGADMAEAIVIGFAVVKAVTA